MLALGRYLRGIRHGERALSLLLTVTYALALFGLYLLKPARDSLFLSQQSAADLPLAFMLTAALAIPVSLAYGRASRSWSLARLHVGSFVLVIVVLVGWWPLLDVPSAAVSYLFYAWAGIAGGLVTSQFWLLGNAVCDAQRAKRLFPMLSLAGIVGAVAGGWVVGYLAPLWNLDALDLVLASAAVWTVALGLSSLALRRRLPDDRPRRREPRTAAARPMRTLLRDLGGSRHLQLIIGIVAISGLVSTFIDFQFKTAAAAAYSERGDLLVYLGTFYARMNLLSLVLQLILTSRLLRGLGVGGTLLVLPTLITLGSVGLLVLPGLAMASILRTSEMSLKYSLDKTSRELLYLPLPLGLKRRVKVFIDTFVERSSRGLAGLLLLLLTTGLGLSSRGLTVVVLILLVGWLLLAMSMRRQYIQSFRRAVARRDIDRDDLRLDLHDPGVVAVLESALDAENPREVAYALSMLRTVAGRDLPARVGDLLDHHDPSVRQGALALLLEAEATGHVDRAADLLDDPDPEIGRLAAAYLHRASGDSALRESVDRSSEARISILEYVARLPLGEKVPQLMAIEDLPDLIAGGVDLSPRCRRAAAAYLGRLWPSSVAELQQALAGQPDEVVGAAVEAVGRQGERARLRELADLLADRALRSSARRAVTAYGPAAVPTLVTVATGQAGEAPTRQAALRALARIPYQRTVDLLLDHLDTAAAELRGPLIPVLLRLRERRPDLRFARRTIERALRREVAESRRLFRITARLDTRETPADRLLQRCLREYRRSRFERIFQLLALLYDVRDIMGAWLRFMEPDQRRRADAQEFLENLLAPHHKLQLTGLREAERARTDANREAALRELLGHENLWLRCCAARAVDPDSLPGLRSELERMRRDGPSLAADTASLMLDAERRSSTMLTIEKAILLESVDHFDVVDSERLGTIAAIAEEVVYVAGDVIYEADDASDAMYLVVDGEVILRRGEEQIATAVSRESFGAWALFEATPRMFGAVASTDCRLLRIDREDFTDLMAEDINVAQSLLRSVARRLRQLASRAA